MRTPRLSKVGNHVSLACTTVRSIPVPDGAHCILMSASAQNIRFTMDGTTDPTTTVGLRLLTTQFPLLLYVDSATVIKALEEVSGGVLQYQFFREIAT